MKMNFLSPFQPAPQGASKKDEEKSVVAAKVLKVTSPLHPSFLRTFPQKKVLRNGINSLGPVYSFVRWSHGFYEGTTPTLTTTLASQAGTINRYGVSFTLNDVPNTSEFTSMFDQWRIYEVEVHLIPRNNVTTTGTTPSDTATYVVSWLDFDNIAFISAGITDGLQSRTLELHSSHNPIVRRFSPKINLRSTDISGTEASGVSLYEGWCDSGAAGIAHYGFKIAIGGTTSASDVVFDIFVKYHLQFRNTI
jgi:hypothetical protein